MVIHNKFFYLSSTVLGDRITYGDGNLPTTINGESAQIYLSGSNVGIGAYPHDAKTLTVDGDISASGDLILKGSSTSGSLQFSGSASSSLKVNTAVSGGLFITASGFSDAFGGVHISGSVFHTGSTFSIGSES